MMAPVRFAARDPGGANVLATLLARHGTLFSHDVWTLPRATPVFRQSGCAPLEFAENFTPAALAAAWRNTPAALLLTGTSHYESFEPALWSLARTHGVRSIAVLDSWINLTPRFAAGRPDCVGAVDEGQRAELVELGFPPDRILLAGHPWLARVAATRSERLANPPPPHPAPPGGVNVLFVSECIAADVAQGVNAPFGFDEFDSFQCLHEAACDAAIPVNLAVKFHPYEDPACFQKRLRELRPTPAVRVIPLPPETNPSGAVAWADLVAGISSMLLLEAMVLGRPVVSVQPGLMREETFIATRRGFADTLTDRAAGKIRLRELIANPAARQREMERQASFGKGTALDGDRTILDWIRSQLPA